MENQKIDFESHEYLKWLHELTVAAYKRNIVIPAYHADAVDGIYALKRDEDIEKCVDRYVDFLARWKALHEPGGDFYQGEQQ